LLLLLLVIVTQHRIAEEASSPLFRRNAKICKKFVHTFSAPRIFCACSTVSLLK
jgi:hypothetical protein